MSEERKMANFVADVTAVTAAHKVTTDPKTGAVLGRKKVLKVTLEPDAKDVDALEAELAGMMGNPVAVTVEPEQPDLGM
jgi:hypothetical protein